MAGLRLFPLRLLLVVLGALLIALAAGAPPVRATIIVVNTFEDELNNDGDCSLREAIVAANVDIGVSGCAAGNGTDLILLPAGTYTLTITGLGDDTTAATGDLDIIDGLDIMGDGSATTIIDGNGGVTGERVFDVDPVFLGLEANILGVTIRNGSAPTVGGGILINDYGSAVLTDVTLTANGASGGAGIWNEGYLEIRHSTISGNAATDSGGGIHNGDILSLEDTTVSGNTAADDGAGISNSPGASLTLSSTTISGNTASSSGGGIFNEDTADLTNVTVSGNTAAANGGGISNFNGALTLTNSTVTGNSATAGSGGGIYSSGTGTATLKNTIVADSASGGDCSGAVTSSGNNLDSDGTCGLGAGGDLPATDPDLSSLADNGGPTLTHALLVGSPAIDAGGGYLCPHVDQRGVARPVDGDENGTATCDIGAYEFEPMTPTPAPTPTPIPTSTPTPTPTPTSVPTLTPSPEPSDTPTATPTGTGTPAAAPSALPPTGSRPRIGGGWPYAALAAGAVALLGAGGALVAVRRRR